MGFKEDFKRAMQETVYGNQLDAEESALEAEEASEVAEKVKLSAKKKKDEMTESHSVPEPVPAKATPAETVRPVKEDIPAQAVHETSNVTVISAGTIIRGGIESEGAIEFNGELVGDVNCKQEMVITGKVEGNVTAERVLLQDALIKGNISCHTSANISADTQIMGDLVVRDARIDGRIMGNVNAEGAIIAGETAVIVGDIIAYTVEIQKGSYFEGKVIMTGPSEEKNRLFDKFPKMV
ncbi:polymer-forming cytoskeletal protein [Ligaoa zhengdingensis]|uniref:bactofilin family protein n=1 Tax=Ligaoa zhengdingensis TaxID=2763658 RepID=UPI0031BA2896